MPLAAGITGAAALAGAAMSATSQGKINKRSMRFQREMFDKTNAYNHPLQQRKRLEAAGLNPNLIYGGSAGGAAGTASQPAQPDLKSVDYTTAGQQLGVAAQNYFSWRQTQTGIEVNEARKENIKQDTINKALDSVNKTIQNAGSALTYSQKARLYNNHIKMEQERLRNLSVNTDYIGNKDAREHRITEETVRKINFETMNLKRQGKILDEEAVIKRIDRELYQNYGLKPQDPYYMRMLHNILEKLNVSPFKP